MKKLLLETSFSKIYIIGMIIITLLILGGYFSYAMFTVSKEKSNAISIVTGNLTYELKVDDEETNTLTVEANTVKDFIVTLSNPNNRIARFNIYYEGNLPSNTKVGYIKEDGVNTPPVDKGINLDKVDTAGSSNTYKVRVINNSGSSVTITLGVSVGLDYNDLSLPDNGHLINEIISKGEVGTVVLSNISEDNKYNDEVDTFTTGQYPNNYVWYSGKLWRAVSVNNESKTVKLVTQWNISTISYDDNSSAFEGSYMQDWLNDTSVDGFLGNLRDYENFIVTDAKWNATQMPDDSKPPSKEEGGTIVEDAVGLLNNYEYATSLKGTSSLYGYLNNGLYWWCLTPHNPSIVHYVNGSGAVGIYTSYTVSGVRPSLNLKSNVKIVSGSGTKDNPYRLEGDNDTNLSGTLLNTRYSGEYISFGSGENNLYRIVSHENGTGTKITSVEPLKEKGIFKTMNFGDTVYYSSSNTIGSFLNGEYLTNYVGSPYIDMIEDETTWYLGTVGNSSYKLAKYTDATGNTLTSNTTSAKVGLLRFGELMGGQFDRSGNNTNYWTLTPRTTSSVRTVVSSDNIINNSPSNSAGVWPSLNLKQNVVITGGTGTKSDPFTIELS